MEIAETNLIFDLTFSSAGDRAAFEIKYSHPWLQFPQIIHPLMHSFIY
jgi:hypothetical protein